jgi:hypothetical protein
MAKEIEGSLYILYHIANHIDLYFKAIVWSHSDKDKYNFLISEFDNSLTYQGAVTSGLTNNILILSCSFLDEWNEKFTPAEYPYFSARILRVKKITKPAIKRMKNWTGLKSYRNIVLAHNLRYDNNSVFTSNFKPRLVIPYSNAELGLLVGLISFISTEVYNAFNDIEIDVNKSILSNLNVPLNQIDASKELEIIFEAMRIIKNSLPQ